ncbi:hypothetical protein DFH27DRAFT_560357 [Peziza echinospora]|nr:hypothetical protein DFH27DRAFT_560357 [Peziza echinospora]
MCDDLIAFYYITASRSTIVHAHPRLADRVISSAIDRYASSTRNSVGVDAGGPPKLAPFYHFTQNSDPNDDARKPHQWLILPSDASWDAFRSQLQWAEFFQSVQEHGGPWSVNVYTKAFLTESISILDTESDRLLPKYLASKAKEVNMLYEMFLSVQSSSSEEQTASPTISRNQDAVREAISGRHSQFLLDVDKKNWSYANEDTNEPSELVISLLPRNEQNTIPTIDTKAGFVTVLREPGTGSRWYVSNLFVEPEYRKVGAGKLLMGLVKESKKLQGGGDIWLTVFAENFGAVGLYFGLGYRAARTLWVLNG